MSNPYAKTYTTTSSDRATRKAELLQQLKEKPELLQQLQTVVKTQDDVSILTELLGEMNMGSSRGGRRRRRTNKRRRTFRKKRSTKRRR